MRVEEKIAEHNFRVLWFLKSIFKNQNRIFLLFRSNLISRPNNLTSAPSTAPKSTALRQNSIILPVLLFCFVFKVTFYTPDPFQLAQLFFTTIMRNAIAPVVLVFETGKSKVQYQPTEGYDGSQVLRIKLKDLDKLESMQNNDITPGATRSSENCGVAYDTDCATNNVDGCTQQCTYRLKKVFGHSATQMPILVKI